MEKNVSRKDLSNAIVKFIKDESKKMNERGKSMEELRIFYSNWVNGARKWSRSVITLGGDKYEFTDKEITEIEFINLLKDALKASGVDGKVFYDEVKNWYNVVECIIFKKLEIYGEPCKEFKELAKYLSKYATKKLGKNDIYCVRVCGKRSSWNDSGRVKYLCYDAEKCKAILDTIKQKKSARDLLTFNVDEFFSHGDEVDYNYAMYAESEWYGSRGTKLHVIVRTPKGKAKLDYEF